MAKKKDPVLEALEDCQKSLEQLRSEKHLTEQAADTFAQLGQRVDAVLEERRITGERRQAPRQDPDRRGSR